MRFLDQAIEEKLYEESNIELRKCTWEDFKRVANGADVYLFGTGEGADYVFSRYAETIIFKKALDNDVSKWGKRVNGFIAYHLRNDIEISSPEVIKDVARECVVLITSIRYCDDIFSQLKNMGVQHIYSLLHMEANRRLSAKEDGYDKHSDERIIFAKECLNREIKDKKIILARDGLAGHGKQIFKNLSRCNLELDLVWVKEKEDADNISGVRTILQSDWKSYIEEIETAHIWIFGDMIPEYVIKRPEQIYIQVKHWASITLKSFYFHLKQHLETKSIYDYYRHNTDAMDYCMVGSDFDEETCLTGFDFEGEFIRVGSPRSDVLFQEGVREKVYDHLGINMDIYTLLYAPTFRSKSSTTLIGCMRDVDLNFEMLKAILVNRFGGEWAILLRIHPDVAIESKKVKRPEYVLDVSDYPDSEELVAASDIMISDYSSIMFEPAFVKKPVFLYAPDADEYIANDRELLLDYFSLPFAVSKSNEELGEAIALFDENKYVREVNAFLNKYGVNEDGHASERAAEFIQRLIFDKAN